MDEQLLGYEDAAALLGLKKGTLHSLVSRREIPFLNLGRRLIRFEPSALRAWMEAKRFAPALTIRCRIRPMFVPVSESGGPNQAPEPRGRDGSPADSETGARAPANVLPFPRDAAADRLCAAARETPPPSLRAAIEPPGLGGEPEGRGGLAPLVRPASDRREPGSPVVKTSRRRRRSRPGASETTLPRRG